MRIAVNTHLGTKHQFEGYWYFIKEVFLRLAERQPQHQFIFFLHKPGDTATVFPQNVEIVVVKHKAVHLLSFLLWFDVKIPRLLKKYKADVFVSPNSFCSLITNVPQVLIVHDLTFFHYPNLMPWYLLWFYKRYMPRFIQKAKVICTASEFLKQHIISQYNVAEEKIFNMGSAAEPMFKPIDWHEREAVKEEFADGCEYFVSAGSIYLEKDLINLVKAFSIFKKWQKTNMKLLLVERAYPNKDTVEKLKTYKYRDDVKVLGYLPEDKMAKVVAAAYASVLPILFESFSITIVEAMQCEVPVITSDKSSIREVGGEAALYASPSNPEEIAAQMKKIFKDEQLRSNLINIGKIQVQKFTWEITVQLMWKSIEQAVSK